VIVDPALPAAVHLLGEGARHLVSTGLRALGGDLRRLEPTQVIYRPGSELTVRYDATVEWADGRVVDEVLCTGTTRSGAPAGTVPLEADGLHAGLWRYPFDPALPGLEPAVMARGVAAVAGAIVGSRPALTVRAYRPGRRAVVHVVGEVGEAYLKVVRPSAFDAMVAVHRSLSPHLPVPEVLAGDRGAGILVLEALPGVGLRDRLRAGDPPWPDATEILGLLDRLAEVPPFSGAEPTAPIPAGTATHLTMIERALPAVAEQVALLRQLLVDERVVPDPDATRLIHGDLHEAQLMVEGARISGLLDIDGVGPGDRVDDLGRLLGHLSTLALGADQRRRSIDAYAESLRTSFAQRVDPVELDLRAASVVTGLAAGPFRVQMRGWRAETRRRLDLAVQWAQREHGVSTSLVAPR
jgi:hypothetical protein